MTRSIYLGTLGALAGFFAWTPAHAADHTNLEEGLPLEIEDAYPIGRGSFELQGFARFERTAEGKDLYRLVPRLEVGIASNTQFTVEVPFELGPAVEDEGIGDVSASFLYNINTETLSLPALGIVGGAVFPTGPDSHGVDPFATFILTKTLGTSSHMHRVHLNLQGLYNSDAQPNEREALYKMVVGYSVRLGADTILLADYVREQEREEGKTINLAEIGLRRQVTPRLVLVAGVGVGLDDDSPDFRATIGFQFSPGAPWFGRGNYGVAGYGYSK